MRRRTRTRKEENSNKGGTKSEPEIVTLLSSSSDEEEEKESKSINKSNQQTNEAKEDNDDDEKEKEKMKKKKKKDETASYSFPMHRIKRMTRSEGGSDLRTTQEATFLISKASEKFLELFCEDAYACSVQEHKNYVSYKHLSSVICKRKRFDFLSDFVPEKLKAEDALAERNSAGT